MADDVSSVVRHLAGARVHPLMKTKTRVKAAGAVIMANHNFDA
jgi:hypothetical protein